jgi:hypothetical protein
MKPSYTFREAGNDGLPAEYVEAVVSRLESEYAVVNAPTTPLRRSRR